MTPQPHPLRCETCGHFVGKMTNFFGVDQPFCKNPIMIEYYKSLPKDPGTTPDKQQVWLPSHVIREGDLWFSPLSEYDVNRYRVMGCASHSSRPGPKAPSHERIGSIRQNIYQEDAYLIERVNAGMGEWEYVIQYCGEYYATAPTENIARDIVERAQWSRPAPSAPEPQYLVINCPTSECPGNDCCSKGEECLSRAKINDRRKQRYAATTRNEVLDELEALIRDKWEFMFGILPYNTEVSKDSLYKMIKSPRSEVRR